MAYRIPNGVSWQVLPDSTEERAALESVESDHPDIRLSGLTDQESREVLHWLNELGKNNILPTPACLLSQAA